MGLCEPLSDHQSALRERAWSKLRPYAIPDPRFNFDFQSFIPDFENSSAAIDRVIELPCYQNATTVFISPDNCLRALRLHALRHGKKVLTTSYGLRKGFWVLDPDRVDEAKFEVAGLLNENEGPGTGKQYTLAQLEEAGIGAAMCITGANVVDTCGTRVGNGSGTFDIAWAMMSERHIVEQTTPIVVVVHNSQVIDGATDDLDVIQVHNWDVGCNFIATPEKLYEIGASLRARAGIYWDKVQPAMIDSMPPLQELKGIQMMEQIMRSQGPVSESVPLAPKAPTNEELVGIQMVESIMKGYRV